MILAFVLQVFIPLFTEIFVLNQSSWTQPWRFVSAIFLHGGFGHIAYNLFALVLFGSILESLIGSKKFLAVFFVTGILANLVSVNFYNSSLGASGAIFGIIGAMIFIKPGQFVWAFGLPMPIFIAGILWAVGDAIGIFIPDNVGNIAHLSGMFFGLVLGAYYRKGFLKRRRYKDRKLRLDERSMRKWEDSYLK